MNNSFARARNAFLEKNIAKYQELAKLQTNLGADYLTLNIDSTQKMNVTMDQMLDFLPDLVPAIQEVTSVPIAFDNPSVVFHTKAFSLYKQTDKNQPILNSVAASREHLNEMIDLVAEHDTKVIVMASEKFVDGGGGAQCTSPNEVYQTAREHVRLLKEKAARKNDEIIIDPGLAPISADIYGSINTSLDAMKLIRQDPDLDGIHISIGLTNFSFGVPKDIKTGLENAFITLALANGLDYILGNPEKDLKVLEKDSKYLKVVSEALELGRPKEGETQDTAGFRQSSKIMELYS
jgi:cobalamin-dependent methionine synthase I